MSSFTRQAIMDAFLRLLLKKPFGKVTVRDIVEECGVNRTTFYYYYQDIYVIVEDIVSSLLGPCVQGLLGEVPPEDIKDASDFLTLHRPSLIGLWRGLGEETVRKYFNDTMDKPLRAAAEQVCREVLSAEEVDEQALLFCREILFGYCRLRVFGEIADSALLLGKEEKKLLCVLLTAAKERGKGETSDE